ncbi:glutathione S-transferase C-terminal domain-containing protein [Roseibacterium sp. SDUM158017]|uniref:glutathione S-transferase C-terminal domain-containing protein n=1 Tax=Roseicyclus salinarum TaxID=3036773 RepID=UPI002415128C|nr:glutathione S-transferase C-terminal domain-containing protein [Roseibacterium sp. SDUM158017]MDG4647903.1 glutathione S-transferase C-terminal domain-containing protein [Roseibacterium sp. SDUM158017]
MGMLIGGVWSEEDRIWSDGAYVRSESAFRGAMKRETITALRQEPDRFLLIASESCPWSHRTRLVLAVKDVDAVAVHLAHGPRVEGYSIAGGAPWTVPGTDRSIRHLHQLYSLGHPDHTGRATVPVLWDKVASRIVSNESSDIVVAFDQAFGETTLAPRGLERASRQTDDRIYNTLNNGVYKAGFAKSQEAFDVAAQGVFDTLAWLDQRLATSRFLHGNVLTLSDLRLFPTLVRFDLIYHFLFGCSRYRLRDLPSIWGYARDLFSHPGIRATVNFPPMIEAAYCNDGRTGHSLRPCLPEIDWDFPHDRDALGTPWIQRRDGELVPFGSNDQA